MKFWKWYLKGILKLLRWLFSPLLLRALISPPGEYIVGVVILALPPMLLTGITHNLSSLWWLFQTMPTGLTVMFHVFWRWEKK